jgi:hypothetical protein
MAVFQAPPVPGCWRGGEVIRIVDPLGLQVAWVAPALAGGIVGYYARSSATDAWTEVLSCSAAAGREAGSEVLLGDPGSRDLAPAHGLDAGWWFASRDPTETTATGRIDGCDVSVSLWCADGELHIDIDPGAWPRRLSQAGLRLYPGAAVEVKAVAATSGEVTFRGGALDRLAILHPPGMACRVYPADQASDGRIEVVPTGPLPEAGMVSIALIPVPRRAGLDS